MDNDDEDDTDNRQVRQVPITVGNRIEILDPEQIWNSAIISSASHLTSSTLITVRYDGWDANWNEQLPSTSKRLAPIYTHTARLRCMVKLLNRNNGNVNGNANGNAKNKSKGGGGKSKSKKFCNIWPCAVYIRMANEENSRALQDLAVEQKLFVSPYRPDLLPQYAQREWKNGGIWVNPRDKLKFWRVDCEETFEAFKSGSNHNAGNGNIPSLGTVVNGFMEAYRECKSDRSIPGNYTNEILHKGTVLKKEFRGTENYLKLVGSDMREWKDKIVDLKSLERITKIKKKVASSTASVKSSSSLSSMTSAPQQIGNGNAAGAAGGRRASRRNSTGTSASETSNSAAGVTTATDVRQSRRARSVTKHFIEDAELESEILKASAASLSLLNEKSAMDRGKAMDMSIFQPGERAAARAAHANFKHIEEAERERLGNGSVGVNRHGHGHGHGVGNDSRSLRSGGGSPPPTLNSENEISSPLPLEPGEAMLNTCNAIPMQDSNFNGYKITQSSSMWIGSYQVRGNTIQVGEFKTQSEAKDAIDRSRAELIRSGNASGSGSGPRQDASIDTTRSITSPSSSFSRRSSSNTKSPSPISPTIAATATTGGRSKQLGAREKLSPAHLLENKQDKAHKDREIAAISMSRAVSLAYRDRDDDRPQGGNGGGPSSINGELKDTGFSMHNWTLAVVKDTDKIRLQQDFIEMKRKRRAGQHQQQNPHRDENRHQYQGQLQNHGQENKRRKNLNIAPSKRARSEHAA
eukprot:CAMPEP_0194102290 /NCGR_PEP_ID=MMETSP0150-20130528/2915_1 /TAXON_ID=122233 /ORGANISM="Chaetoceros debilis, Strain MM31A-1" /LENGTH=749 /DNA_ID=CAMNT_0038789203 /DNA_START=353 /DNA_END=2602 /DNA_ORIENTATION=+